MSASQESSGRVDELLAQVAAARGWSPGAIAGLRALLVSADEAALLHVNPFRYAQDQGLSEGEAVELFLHAANAGLFRMDWSLLCHACGFRIDRFETLRLVRSQVHCNVCQADRALNLDDWIQVSFTVSGGVRRLRFHDPEALSARDYYCRYLSAAEARLPSGESGAEFAERVSLLLEQVPAGAERTFEVDLVAGMLLGAISSHDGEFAVPVTGEPAAGGAPRSLALELTAAGLGPVSGPLGAGRASIRFRNSTDRPAHLMAVNITPDWQWSECVFERFLTGSELLANPTFRRLFRSEEIDGAEGLGIKWLTLVFTDLQGSTALYERIGDLKAFSLVRAHFERLEEAVQRYGGAVVKTIGDAVMAVFMEPADAVRAANDMLRAIDDFNREHGAEQLVLKIGIHSGPSIAVTLNRNLDYFGHTVNLAARVQGLAGPNEIWLTEAVLSATGVRGLFSGQELIGRDVQVKGITRGVRAYRTVLTSLPPPAAG